MENERYQILGPFCLVFGNDLFRQPLDVMLESIFRLHVGFMLAQRASFGVKVSISQDGSSASPLGQTRYVNASSGKKGTYLMSSTSSPALFLRNASKRAFRSSEAAARDMTTFG
jgi:hypothetical protein